MTARDDFEKLRDTIQEKIKHLLDEFQTGNISREQFNIIYERYSNQLELALHVAQGDADELEGGITTDVIRDATAGKATAIAIYHHSSSTMIETLGNYELNPEDVTPILSELSEKIDTDAFLEPMTKQLGEGQWLVYITEKFTTAIVVFRNEPSARQIKNLDRIMHDFENANHSKLEKSNVNSAELAQPFMTVVRLHKHE